MSTVTYGHRRLRTRDPVRSPIDKQAIARLVLGWVTTGESLVSYVSFLLFSIVFGCPAVHDSLGYWVYLVVERRMSS
jgi:hypothetical protein